MPDRVPMHIAGRHFGFPSAPRFPFVVALLLLSIAPSVRSETADDPFDDYDRSHWSLQPLSVSPLPGDNAAAAHPVDAFLDARLAARQVSPVPEADRRTLIRRATFDLHGLPPTPEEVEAFVADDDPLAYEKLIDRLLESPRYGEHWARHWLDLVRYAESDGFKSDLTRPHAWRYRDYVIRSLNDDKPYDRFVMEQLAGDELDPDNPEALVATGYLRLWPYEDNGRNVAEQRADILNDITDVTGQVFLGLTIGCARCHDHKYDPILQADYYRLQAFFASITLGEDEPLGTRDQRDEYQRQYQAWDEATRALRAELEAIEAPIRDAVRKGKRQVFPDYVQEILDTPDGQRSPLQFQIASMTEKQLQVSRTDIAARLKKDEERYGRWEALHKELAEFDSLRPKELPPGMVARDIGPQAPETRIAGLGERVEPGFLTILAPGPAPIEPPSADSTGRRLALARWIADPDNPLTARTFVNRVWQQHFGRGLVGTASDFGRQGDYPTHPELLDWLAAWFIEGGWRIKPLHRLLMTSAAYRRSSDTSAHDIARKIDPDNRLWWHMPRRRLTAEQLRDATLAASGELNLAMGGPSVRPELPEGISAAYAWKPTDDAAERNRRSIYMFVRRNLRHPLLEAFDMPDTHESCARRMTTTTAPQALLLLNGDWSLERARALAGRLLRDSYDEDEAALIGAAYRTTLLRQPDAEEVRLARRFLDDQTAILQERLAREEPLALPLEMPDAVDAARGAALVDLCHVLFNSNEFAYLD